ncbi:MAG: replicative DNA helicase, partial [Synergistales bacterium]|nr:replicative DNA helicase [Synergistales bacterium]
MSSLSSWDRTPPVSPEAERAALGACLMDREALNIVLEILQPEDFYDMGHRTA